MKRVVLFGATGYQGSITARALLERGVRPLLAGRSHERLARLARMLGGLEHAHADAADGGSLRRLLAPGDVLVSTVGPFVRLGFAQVQAAIDAGAHCLDSCGEAAYYHQLQARFGASAAAAGCAVLSACAYDFFPGNLVADHVLRQAGEGAVRVVIGYAADVAPGYRVSAGSRATGLASLLDPALFFRGGRYVLEPIGQRLGSFELNATRHTGFSMAGTEPLFLPALHPQLKDVEAYWAWAGAGTRVVHRALRALARLDPSPARAHWLSPLLGKLGKSDGTGPSASLRERSASYVCATAYDAQGTPLAAASLGDSDGHTFTAKILAWAADTILRAGLRRTGVIGPVQAFGRDALLSGHAQAGFTLTPLATGERLALDGPARVLHA